MILGTAGHIDHGKTALVRALTGVDTDRLPEEKRRGITIDLGFAPLRLDGGPVLGVVDVPGHEAFVRTMLAGATGIDLALLVVAADEGVMPQTREHLQILQLLGVQDGIVAITKRDLVDGDWLALVLEDVRELIAPTALAGAAVVPVSAQTGQGLEDLRSAIAEAAKRVSPRGEDDLFRMPIDRAFTVKGTGTVVTGTVWSGTLTRDAAVTILPAGRKVRIRGIQQHGEQVERAVAGSRAAIALAGVDLSEVERGATLVDDPHWRPTRIVRATVSLLDPGLEPPDPARRLRLHLGTQVSDVRIVPARGQSWPAPSFAARLHLDEPMAVRAGDRFVLREASPAVTVGGGFVIDPYPPGQRPHAWAALAPSPEERLRLMLDEAAGHGVAVRELPVRLGVAARACAALAQAPGVMRAGDVLFAIAARDEIAGQITKLIDNTLCGNPLEPGVSLQDVRSRLAVDPGLFDAALQGLVGAGSAEVEGALVRPAGWRPRLTEQDRTVLAVVRDAMSGAGREPPSVSELVASHGVSVPALLRLLERERVVVSIEEDRYIDARTLDEIILQIRRSLEPGRDYSPAELRELLGLSRKYLIPLLEYCDRRGVTRRTANGRVLGGAETGRPVGT